MVTLTTLNEKVTLCRNDIMYILCIFCRVVTRATVIPFREPSISPNNEEEEDAFTELEELILSGELSRAVGRAIQQRQVLLSNKETLKSLKERLRKGLVTTGQFYSFLYR